MGIMKLIEGICHTLQQEIDSAIAVAEQERNFFDVVLRADITNQIQLRSYIYEGVQHQDTFLMLTGCMNLRRMKANVGRHDYLEIELRVQMKALTVDIAKMRKANDNVVLRFLMFLGCCEPHSMWTCLQALIR